MTEQEIAKLVVRLSANIKPFERAMHAAEGLAHKAAATMTNSMKAVGSAIAGATKTLALAGGAGAVGFAGWGIKLAADAEQAQVAFGVMLGSADQAKKMLASLNQFAASTPFELPGITQAAKSLLAFGVEADKIQPTLTMLGDLASGLSIPLTEMSDLYGKMQTQGTVFTEDLNQLSGRGIPVIAALAEQFNVAESAIRVMASKGQIHFDDIQRALIKMTGEGGRFENMMAKQAETIAGRWSTLKDNVAASARDVGVSISEAIDLKGLLDKTSKFLQFFSRSWGDVIDYTIKNWQLGFVTMYEDIKYFFTDQAIPMLKAYPTIWWETFKTVLANAARFGVALWKAIKGEGWEFELVGFSQAWYDALASIPKQADRQLTKTEVTLTREMNVLANKMGNSWNKAFSDAEPTAKVALEVEEQAKVGELPDYLKRVEDQAVKAKAAIDAMKPNTVVRGGTAEAYMMKDQLEATKLANQPKMEGPSGYTGVKDLAPNTEDMLDQLRIQTDLMQEEQRERSSEFSLIPTAGLSGV